MVYLFLRSERLIRNKTDTTNKTIVIQNKNPPTAPPMAVPADPELVSSSNSNDNKSDNCF